MSFDWYIKNKLERKPKKRCCDLKQNLQYPLDLNTNPNIVVLKCRVCGRTHRNMLAQSIRFSLKFK